MTPQEKLYRAWLKAGKPERMPRPSYRRQQEWVDRQALLCNLITHGGTAEFSFESKEEAANFGAMAKRTFARLGLKAKVK